MAYYLFPRPLADNHLHLLCTSLGPSQVLRPFPLHALFHRVQLHRLHLSDGSIQSSSSPVHLG